MQKRQWNRLRIMVVMAALQPALALGDVWHVDDSATTGWNTGFDWPNAFVDLQSALAVAGSGDEIRIAQGVYRPAPPNGPREATFNLVDGVTLSGGYAGADAIDPDANDPTLFLTVLSGDLNDNDLFDTTNNFLQSHADNALHVVSAHGLGLPLKVRGVTISGGWAMETEPPHHQGGGIHTTSSVLHLERVTLEHNFARVYGGGVQAGESSAQSVLHMGECLVRGNGLPVLWSSGAGGGVYAGQGSTFVDCRFEFNSSSGGQDAGALYLGGGSVVRCVFLSNYAEDGGAVSGGGFVMQDCLFQDNRASYWGGAMWIGGPTTLINCKFLGNRFAIVGGAIRHRGGVLNAVNCLFSGNSADGGGAVSIDSHPSNPSHVTFTNCTLAGNRSYFLGGGGIVSSAPTLILNNCVVWDNLNPDGTTPLGAQVSATPGTLATSHCIVQGWPETRGGTTTGENPQFIDADGPDDIYGTADDNPRLSPGSPARDTGDNAALLADEFDLDDDGDTLESIPHDLDAHRRIANRVVDRGCYEYQTCPADIAPLFNQGDGVVDHLDLLAVIAAWGASISPVPEDIIPDLQVNVADLLAVIDGWGLCP